MCGFVCASFFNSVKNQIDFVTEINNSMDHRGGEKSHIVLHNNFILAHNRLPIVGGDIGVQPIKNDKFCMVYNGEIYAHKNISIYNQNVISDTKFLFRKINQLKSDISELQKFMNSLDGMWSIALVENKSIYLFRDYFGQKPLYFIRLNHGFLACSDLNAVRLATKKFNNFAIEDVKEITQGSIFKISNNFKEIINFFNSANFSQYKTISYQKYPKNNSRIFDELLISVAKRYTSGINSKIALSLSGGVDSSVLAIALSKVYPKKKLLFFSLASKSVAEMDIENAKKLSKILGVKHNIINITPKAFFLEWKKLNKLIPFGIRSPSMIAHSILLKKVSENDIKIIFEGQGADEFLGGYQTDRDHFKYNQINFPLIIQMFKSLSLVRLFLLIKRKIQFGNFDRRKIVDSNLFKHPLPMLLKYGDWINMYHNIENRLIFLSPEIVNFSQNFKDIELFNDNNSKLPLRNFLVQNGARFIADYKVKNGYELDWHNLTLFFLQNKGLIFYFEFICKRPYSFIKFLIGIFISKKLSFLNIFSYIVDYKKSKYI